MKRLYILSLLLLFIVVNTVAQQRTTKAQEPTKRYIIVDRKLKKSLTVADSITNEQMNKGFFAVETRNVDSLIAKLEIIRKRLKQVAREKYDEVKWPIGSTLLTIRVVKWTFGDRLNVALSTDVGNGHSRSFYVVDARYSNNDNANYLKKLISYIDKGI